MTDIAVLGSGTVGTSLALGLARAGHTVLIGTSRPERAPSGELREAGVRLTTHASAVEPADVVFNTTPGELSVDILRPLEPQLRGRILVDVSNAHVRSPEGFPAAPVYPESSLAEELQKALPRTRVVKSLNTMDSRVMINPSVLPVPATACVSGDDAGAKETLVGLLRDLGWKDEWILDLGGLYNARAQEWVVLMLGPFVTRHGLVPFSLAIVH
ncbi:NADPH-dependent F420 reductase [Streptomyces sp. NPDC058964]|uniref:NADPH-dependent F420 reductase n=1 Tax=Streptomyces sp. NPDC058964 TaxID=3346681 RepID=UPI00367401F6